MANDLATLKGYLETALRDTSNETWTDPEVGDLVTWAVEALHPRFTRPLDPTATTVGMTLDTYYYALPAGVLYLSRVDHVGSDGFLFGPLPGNAWEVVGDLQAGSGKLFISPQVERVGDTLRLVGYGKYDVTTNLIPNYLTPLVLAKARAEAYHRVMSDRERFRQWLARNQVQNISVNEMLQMVRQAEQDAERLARSTPRVWQKPVEGRIG